MSYNHEEIVRTAVVEILKPVGQLYALLVPAGTAKECDAFTNAFRFVDLLAKILLCVKDQSFRMSIVLPESVHSLRQKTDLPSAEKIRVGIRLYGTNGVFVIV